MKNKKTYEENIASKIENSKKIKSNIKNSSDEDKKNMLLQMTNDMAQLLSMMDLTNNQVRSLFFLLKNTKMNSKPREFHKAYIKDYLKQYELDEQGISFYKNEFQALRDKSVWKGDTLIGILDKATYNPEDKSFSFRYDEDFEKGLLNLGQFYLLTWAVNAECLPDKGCSFFYLFLRSSLSLGKTTVSYYDLKPKITEPKKIRTKKQIKKKALSINDVRYERYRDWKKNILDPYIKFINELTDIDVSYKEIGSREKDKIFEFTINANEKNKDMLFVNDPAKKVIKNKKAKDLLTEELLKLNNEEDINREIAERLNKYICEKVNQPFHFQERFYKLLDEYKIKEEVFKVILDIVSLKDPIIGTYIDKIVEDWDKRKIDSEEKAKIIYKGILRKIKEDKKNKEKITDIDYKEINIDTILGEINNEN